MQCLQTRAVGVARSGALQRSDLVVAGLSPRRALTEFQLGLVNEALRATESVSDISMESFVEQTLVSHVMASAHDGVLTQQMLDAAGVEEFACVCHLKLTQDILHTDNMTLNARNNLGDTALHKTTRGNALK